MASTDYILIAEDDEDDRLLLVSAFREISTQHELVFVENGIQLVEHFKAIEKGEVTNFPSLLIVDLNMPKKNGREAIMELAGRSYFNEVKTVIFTTSANEFEMEKCRQLGISDCFVKPANYTALLDIVTRFREMALG
jgi:CheY-like chemotaxis protein